MKRRIFLKSGLAAPLLVESPAPPDDRAKKAVLVASGKNRVNETFSADQMEDFFLESGKRQRRPTAEESQTHFRAHGMEIVGPPLPIE